jgi:hypothetical protein
VDLPHVFAAIHKEGSGVAANVLRNMGWKLDAYLEKVRDLMTAGPNMITMGKLPQTPALRQVIEYTCGLACGLHNNYIGTEHLLLGLLWFLELPDAMPSPLGAFLCREGVTYEKVFAGVKDLWWIKPPTPVQVEKLKETQKQFEEKIQGDMAGRQYIIVRGLVRVSLGNVNPHSGLDTGEVDGKDGPSEEASEWSYGVRHERKRCSKIAREYAERLKESGDIKGATIALQIVKAIENQKENEDGVRAET